MLRLTYTILSLFICVCFESGTMVVPRVFTFCPDNWMACRGSCYYFHRSEQSFIEAQRACAQLNSNLVQIDSVEENLFIKDFISHHTPIKDWWIGLSDADIEGIWKWAGSGNGPTYTDWFPGEPNNYGNNEDCVNYRWFDNRSIMWVDSKCSLLCFSICELRSETSSHIVVG